MNNADKEYNRLAQLVLDQGRIKKNRTGTDTLGVFGAQARFDLSKGFPLLTTKKVFFKSVLHELLWFLKGDTNIKYLVDNDVHIWDGNCHDKFWKTYGPFKVTERELDCKLFIENIKNDKDFAETHGELGEGTYGGMWRAFPYFIPAENRYQGETLMDWKDPKYEDKAVGYVDQIQKVVDKLKNNPDDRRIIVCAWHSYWVDHCALPPCHVLFQFHTEELTLAERREVWSRIFFDACDGYNCLTASEEELDKNNVPKRRLNCQLYQRSCDLFLGVPFNIASYAMLTQLMAHVSGMAPGDFVHTFGDLHIYTNHIDQIKEQIKREPKKLARLKINPNLKSIHDAKFSDFTVEGYESHPAIKGVMAV